MTMDFSGKHMIVTGGTGALGIAVVSTLIGAGATCTVPFVHETEAQRFPYSGQDQVTLLKVSDLADEAEVTKLYASARSSAHLWGSIHLAGGFAAATPKQQAERAEHDRGSEQPPARLPAHEFEQVI